MPKRNPVPQALRQAHGVARPGRQHLLHDETDYAAWDGTSMAAPFVTGVAALLRAAHPQRDAAWIAGRLRTTAIKLPEMKGRAFTHRHGYDMLNGRGAL